MLGMIIGVGVLVLDKFGIAVKDSVGVNETITFTNSVGVTVQGTTANDDVTSITSIINGTGSRAAYSSTSYNFTTAGVINLDPVSTTVTNETLVLSGGYGKLSKSNITAINGIINSSETDLADIYSWIGTGINWSIAGNFSSNESSSELWINYTFNAISLGTHDVIYVYAEDSTSTTTVGNVNTSIGTIASTWLPLVVTIFILAIILTLVIRSFVVGKR